MLYYLVLITLEMVIVDDRTFITVADNLCGGKGTHKLYDFEKVCPILAKR